MITISVVVLDMGYAIYHVIYPTVFGTRLCINPTLPYIIRRKVVQFVSWVRMRNIIKYLTKTSTGII